MTARSWRICPPWDRRDPSGAAGRISGAGRRRPRRTAALLAEVPAEAGLLVDGLAYGGAAAGGDPRRRTPVSVPVHHPLATRPSLAGAGGGPGRERARRPGLADRVVATSRFTARLLAAEFGVAPARIAIAEPGTRPAARVAPRPGPHVRLLSVGTVTPRKGYAVLVEALAVWPISTGRSRSPAASTAARLHRLLARPDRRFGPENRITLRATVTAEALERLYAGPTSRSRPRCSRATAWLWPRPWPAACPSSPPPGAPPPRRWPPGAGQSVPPGDASVLAAALRALIADPARAPRPPRRPGGRAAPAGLARHRRGGRRRHEDTVMNNPVVRTHERLPPDWLAVREPADHAARDAGLVAPLARALPPHVRAVDLGCGTGSNLRALGPHLGPAQDWVLVDHDPPCSPPRRSASRPGPSGRRPPGTA